MKHYEKFAAIISNRDNGQMNRFHEQVKVYGKMAFISDVLTHEIYQDYQKIDILKDVMKGAI